MPSYEYKVIRWTSSDAVEPSDIIDDETSGQWEFHQDIQLHSGAVDIVFRRPGG